jgi:hypothetical protein
VQIKTDQQQSSYYIHYPLPRNLSLFPSSFTPLHLLYFYCLQMTSQYTVNNKTIIKTNLSNKFNVCTVAIHPLEKQSEASRGTNMNLATPQPHIHSLACISRSETTPPYHIAPSDPLHSIRSHCICICMHCIPLLDLTITETTEYGRCFFPHRHTFTFITLFSPNLLPFILFLISFMAYCFTRLVLGGIDGRSTDLPHRSPPSRLPRPCKQQSH